MRAPSTSSEAKLPDTAPLDDAEITRLIAAARAEKYRPSETPLQATVDTFRPKSLLDLALRHREAEKTPDIVVGNGPDDDIIAPDIEQEQGLEGEAITTDAELVGEGVDQTAPDVGVDDAADGIGESGLLEDGADDGPPAASAAGGVAVDQSLAADPDVLEQVRSEAFAAGRADAEAEAQERLTAAIEALEAAAKAFLNPPAEVLGGLQADITEAVLKLASDRAGLEIDDMPSAFVERIEALANRIHGQATQAVVRLNPEDFTAIEGLIGGSDSLASMRIVTSDVLSRGDVDLAVDGLRISDRILGQPARRKSSRASAAPTQDNT